ncbi:MAG: nitroreductase [Chloroflexi bacterium]|nr:nitroreductase [Chloroflexota bacterium]
MNETGPGPVSVLDAIRARRSVREFLDKPVPRGSLERMLDAARWAPNHRLTFPWRFFLLEKGGEMRARVASLSREWTFENNAQLPEPKRTQTADAARHELLKAPAFIYAYSVPGANEEVTRENYAAVCISCQNMQLVAVAEGLSMGWSTGRPTRHQDLGKTLGADPSWQLVGAFFIGYPAVQPKAQRAEITGHVSWL